MNNQPTIVLVHGFWGGAAHWSKVIVELARMGYASIRAVELPLTSLADDAERTRKMVAQISGPVLLVGHSYGGAVISECGDQPNVVGLVYIAAFAPDAGESPGGITQEHPPVAAPNLAPDSDGYLWIKPEKFHESFCQDLTPDESLVMTVTQKAPLASTFGNTVTAPAWKQKPSWYQISSEDRMIAPANQERMSSRLGARKVITLAASHASLASKPLEVSALIAEAASEAASRLGLIQALDGPIKREGATAMTSSLGDAVIELASRFSGQLLQPADAGYEEARKVHNGLVDKRPALIARCRGVADVVDAINLARKLNLEVAVRGGGHNVAGRAIVDAGLMVDLAPMKGIYVDPHTRTARAQGGVTWAEFNRETQLHGLAVTGGVVSTTGIAGLTLGGGLGWLMGKYGLALDNLRSVDLVTAEGRVLRASKDEQPDLFWALRGGGGNFGVATSFEYQLHPVGPTITGGLVAYPFERARDVLRFFRDFTASLPDEMTVFGGLLHAPDGSGAKLAAMVTCHCGSLAAGETATRPLKQFGSPVMDAIGPMPYCQLNGMLDAGFPKGALNYWKSSFLTRLSDDAIDTMVDCFARCPTPMGALLLEHFHGAATRVGGGDTAFPHRVDGDNLLVLSEWIEPAHTELCIAWARKTYAEMERFMAPGRYVNYLADDETGDPVAAAYGPNFRRLQELKIKYDPSNFFHVNQNIRPS